jgi:hypothetical protein
MLVLFFKTKKLIGTIVEKNIMWPGTVKHNKTMAVFDSGSMNIWIWINKNKIKKKNLN